MAATIKMVAARAGVSVATVSKYINGGNVIEVNKVRVQEAIDELDYTINEVARSLKTNKTYTVGILASSITSYFISGVISCMQYRLLELGYTSIIADFQEDKNIEKKQVESILKRHVDGIILFPLENETTIIKNIQQQNIPVVIVDNYIEGVECDAILSDSRTGIYESVDKLITEGHERIGMITGPESMYTARERFQGYEKALRKNGMELEEDLIHYSDYNVDGGYKSMKALLHMENRPSAIVIGNYYMTIGGMKALREEGIKVPEDISLVTFDELDFSSIIDAKFDIICQPIREMGNQAAQRIVQRINGDNENLPTIDKLATVTI